MTGAETPLGGGNMSSEVVRVGDTVRRPAGPWTPAYAMHGFAPLSANPAYQRADAGRRLRVIADAYGLTEQQRLDIIPLLARRTQAMHAFLAERAAQGAGLGIGSGAAGMSAWVKRWAVRRTLAG